MALLANYPVAVAPAMGHNFFFAYVVVLTMKVPWQTALGAVLVSGLVFIATASFGLREMIVAAVPASLKSAIAVGIGLLITLIGLEWAGLVRLDPNTFVTLGQLGSKACAGCLTWPGGDRGFDGLKSKGSHTVRDCYRSGSWRSHILARL